MVVSVVTHLANGTAGPTLVTVWCIDNRIGRQIFSAGYLHYSHATDCHHCAKDMIHDYRKFDQEEALYC